MRAAVLLAAIASAEAAIQGFNYGSTLTTGAAKVQSDFEAEFKRAQTLQGTSGFNSARLYTMIQGGTANTPIAAIQAAINTNTGLLLGMWASAGQTNFDNEIAALKTAITQYGTAFTSLVQGISVGSEDLYRETPTSIANKGGVGANPDTIVSYINQVRSAIAGTAASGIKIGHVDTWTAWTNSSNNAVINAVDWIGFDGYPYFQTVNSNGIDNAQNLFTESYQATVAVAGGKEVWITETGWPVSGPTENLAVASIANAKTYWDEVGCSLFGKTNTWWYTLQDASPTTPSPSFGIIGSDLSSAPLYDLSCGASSSSSSTASSASTSTVANVASSATSAATNAASSATTTATNARSSTTTTAAVYAGSSSASAASAQGTGSSPVSGQSPAESYGSAPSGEAQYTTITMTTYLPLESCPATCVAPPTTIPTTLATVPAVSSVSTKQTTAVSSVSTKQTTPVTSFATSATSIASTVSSASSTACPTNLSGTYEYPHLIIPVNSSKPSTALGTSYNGTLSSTVSTIFNFDIPAADAGKTCSLVFLFPQLSQLETSSYSWNGKGGISVSQLSSVATQQTTYSNQPSASTANYGSVSSLQAGNGYVIGTFACPAGSAVAFEFSSTGGLDLEFFEDWNPSPLGAFITVC